MELGNAAKAYEGYRADWQVQNPGVIKPVFVGYFDKGGKEISAAFHASTQELAGVVFTENGLRSARVLADGRVAEKGHDTRGEYLFAVFPSADAHASYRAARSMREVFEWN